MQSRKHERTKTRKRTLSAFFVFSFFRAFVIKYSSGKTKEDSTMTPEQVEEKVIQLIHREPFIPFVVEMTDGQSLRVPHPRLAIKGGGAGFIGPDSSLVDFEFKKVRSICFLGAEAVA